jgi:hypothetical protein
MGPFMSDNGKEKTGNADGEISDDCCIHRMVLSFSLNSSNLTQGVICRLFDR